MNPVQQLMADTLYSFREGKIRPIDSSLGEVREEQLQLSERVLVLYNEGMDTLRERIYNVIVTIIRPNFLQACYASDVESEPESMLE